MNDNPPILHPPQQCLNITEFHEPGQLMSTIHASDADDPETPNGQVMNFSIQYPINMHVKDKQIFNFFSHEMEG